jgi:hypothetical protein
MVIISFALMAGCQSTQNAENKTMKFANQFRVHSAIKSPAEIAIHKLGSKGNPIRVFEPSGERAYLAKLVCTDGSRISYKRGGSAGAGPYGNMLDLYSVSCFIESKLYEHSIYMDMYHFEYQENKAVEGFIFSGQ